MAAPLSLQPLQNNHHPSPISPAASNVVGGGGGGGTSVNGSSDTLITVVTLNAWGIPHVSKDRRKRFKAIAELLVKNADKWDIVCLQEVWSEHDFRMLVQATRECFPSSYHFYSGVMGSGVCVFTRGRIVATLMQRFSLNGYAYKIQHGDWFGGKVCGLAKIVHKGLLINMYATHTHATYSEGQNDEYKSHRIVQSFELSQFIRFTSTPTTLSLAKGIEHSTLPASLTQLAAVAANAATSVPGGVGPSGASQTLPAVSANQYKLVQQQLLLQKQLDELHRQLSSSLSVHAPHAERDDGNITDAGGGKTPEGDPLFSTIDWLHPITIVAGDFNMESYDLGCQLVRRLAGVQDTWENYIRHAKLDPEDEANIDASTSETYDNYYTPNSVRRKRGLHCGKRIDYIFFCQPSGLASPYHIHCLKAAASINKMPDSKKSYSDHKGYVATLSIRRKPLSVALAASRRHIQQRLLSRQFRSPSTNAAYGTAPSTPRLSPRETTPTRFFNPLHRFLPGHHSPAMDAFQRSKSTVDWRRPSSVMEDSDTPVKSAVVKSVSRDPLERFRSKKIGKFSVSVNEDDDGDHHNFYSNGKIHAAATENGTPSHPQVRATQRSIIHDLTGRNEEVLEQAIDIVESGFRRVHRNARKFVAIGILAFIAFFGTFALDSVFRLHIALVITVAVSRVVFIIMMFVCLWLTVVMTRIERNALLAARNTMLLMKGECNPDTLNIDMSTSSSSESDVDNDKTTENDKENQQQQQSPDKTGVGGGAAENGTAVRTVDETLVTDASDGLRHSFSNKLKRSMRRSARMSKRRGGIVEDRSQRESMVLNPNDLLVQMRRNDDDPTKAAAAQQDQDSTPSPTDDVQSGGGPRPQQNLPVTDGLSKRTKRSNKKSKVKIAEVNSPVIHTQPEGREAQQVDAAEQRKISTGLAQKQNEELAELHYHTDGDQLDDDEVTIRGSIRRTPAARKHTTSAEPADTSSPDELSHTVNEHLRRGSGRRRSTLAKQERAEVQPDSVDVSEVRPRPRRSRKQAESHAPSEVNVVRPPLTASVSRDSEAFEADDEFTPSSTPTDEVSAAAAKHENNFVDPLTDRPSPADAEAKVAVSVPK